MASGIYHHTIETKADAIAAKTLGPKVLNSMIEMNKARLTYEEILWDMGYGNSSHRKFSITALIFYFVNQFPYLAMQKSRRSY
jgi:hypothetical protein